VIRISLPFSGGSRASDRSLRSTARRDIDELALSSIIMAKTPQQGRRADQFGNAVNTI